MVLTGSKIIMNEVFPNWDSIEEVYLLAAGIYHKSHFKADELAQIRLGPQASHSAVEAESASVYNALRFASMYGLVESYGGNEFSLKILPEDPEETWNSVFVNRAKVFRSKIIKKLEEEKKRPAIRGKIETKELDNKFYIVSYVGAGTTGAGVDSFVFNTWDPKEHEGIVLCAWSHNIKIAKGIAEELKFADEREDSTERTFKYSVIKEDIYRNDRGSLCGDVYLKVAMI